MFTTRAIHRAWIALSSHLLSVGYADFGTREHEKSLSLYTNAQLIDEFYREITNEPFAALRASNGFALQVPENLWQIAKYHLEQAPQNWTVVHEVSTEHELRNLIAQCPQFSPSRLLLAELLEKRGATTEAQAERATYQELSSVEMQSPLYS